MVGILEHWTMASPVGSGVAPMAELNSAAMAMGMAMSEVPVSAMPWTLVAMVLPLTVILGRANSQ